MLTDDDGVYIGSYQTDLPKTVNVIFNARTRVELCPTTLLSI